MILGLWGAYKNENENKRETGHRWCQWCQLFLQHLLTFITRSYGHWQHDALPGSTSAKPSGTMRLMSGTQVFYELKTSALLLVGGKRIFLNGPTPPPSFAWLAAFLDMSLPSLVWPYCWLTPLQLSSLRATLYFHTQNTVIACIKGDKASTLLFTKGPGLSWTATKINHNHLTKTTAVRNLGIG